MMKIQKLSNCNNSPKNQKVQELTLAFCMQDLEKISSALSEDTQWQDSGTLFIQGKETILTALRQTKLEDISMVTIHQVISHGKEGSAVGDFCLNDGNTIPFAVFFSFSGVKFDKIKTIRSFSILGNSI